MTIERDVAKAWVSASLEHDRQLTCGAFSPCGRFAAAGGADERVRIWELSGGEPRVLEGHRAWIAAVVFSPCGKRLHSADQHGVLKTWDLEGGKELGSLGTGHDPVLNALAVSPDGATLATAGDDAVVRLWSALDGKPLRELRGHGAPVYALAFHPGGALVSGDLRGRILEWDPAGGGRRRELDAKVLHTRGEDFLAEVGGVRCLAFSRDGARLAAGGLRAAKSNTFCPGTPTVLEFDWKTGAAPKTLGLKEASVDGPVNGLVYLEDGLLAGCSETHGGSGGVWFWKPGEEEPFHKASAPAGYAIAAHPDGLRLGLVAHLPKGRGGNGRHAKAGEYVPHGGAIKVYSLHAPPPKTPAPKKK
jgi:hypothetical protein